MFGRVNKTPPHLLTGDFQGDQASIEGDAGDYRGAAWSRHHHRREFLHERAASWCRAFPRPCAALPPATRADAALSSALAAASAAASATVARLHTTAVIVDTAAYDAL